MSDCPCGSGRALEECCGPALDGTTPAATAEALMRSRYSAYALGNIDYVESTLAPAQRRKFDYEGAKHWSESATWQGLTVHETQDGGEADETGVVEFTAAFELSGTAQEHHEVAKFSRQDGAWVYAGGEVTGTTFRRETPKVGRNEPCPCGSGKKFKKCCGR
ncbi:YchJ family protein [Desulfocurvus sp. DL9XJH121]